MARHRDETNGWLWVFPSLLIPLLIAAVAWTTHVASEGDEIAPNVRFAGIDISGLTPVDAAEQVRAREREFLATPVTVDLGEREVVMTAEEAGYVYLSDQTLADLVSARHGDGIWSEFKLWAGTPFETVTINDRFALDVTTATARVSQEDFVIEHPIEPVLTNSDASYMYVVPGTDGTGVDVGGIVDDLVDAEIAAGPVAIEATQVAVPPTVSDDSARDAALELNEMTRPGFLAVVGDYTAQLSPGKIRSHLRSTIEDGEISVTLDIDGFQEEVEAAFPEPVGEFVDPVLQVVDGNVTVESVGEAAPVCCSRESVEAAANQYLAGGQTFYSLEPRPDDDPQALAWAGRVVDHRARGGVHDQPPLPARTGSQTSRPMADFVRGKYLLPGETFSINDYVRAPHPRQGLRLRRCDQGWSHDRRVGWWCLPIHHDALQRRLLRRARPRRVPESLDLFLQIPIWPGGDALRLPDLDLVVTNSTDYPVLIWPTYDDTSITVTLYSTKNVTVEELGQRISRRNQCTHSEIDRQRTFSDGSVEVDTIVANYRPGDGIDCNGNPIPEED